MEEKKNSIDLLFERNYIGKLASLDDQELAYFYNHMINPTNKKIILNYIRSKFEKNNNLELFFEKYYLNNMSILTDRELTYLYNNLNNIGYRKLILEFIEKRLNQREKIRVKK